jgi:hypothetical protein
MGTSFVAVGVVLGFILKPVLTHIVKYLRSCTSEWHGTWYEIIPEQHDLSERWDLIEIRQDGDTLTGTAKRIRPVTEKNRLYSFQGYTDGDRMIGFFALANRRKLDPASYIPITLIKDENNGTVWRGSYTWPAYSTGDDIVRGTVKTGYTWWQRDNPKIKKVYASVEEMQRRGETD